MQVQWFCFRDFEGFGERTCIVGIGWELRAVFLLSVISERSWCWECSCDPTWKTRSLRLPELLM
jgi:hypothetical protein